MLRQTGRKPNGRQGYLGTARGNGRSSMAVVNQIEDFAIGQAERLEHALLIANFVRQIAVLCNCEAHQRLKFRNLVSLFHESA